MRRIASTRVAQWRQALAAKQQGKLGWILLWLVGIPVPILVILFLLRGCT